MNARFEIKPFGSKWVIEKNGKVVSQPMSKKDAQAVLQWKGVTA